MILKIASGTKIFPHTFLLPFRKDIVTLRAGQGLRHAKIQGVTCHGFQLFLHPIF
jgi:hypothetical protein